MDDKPCPKCSGVMEFRLGQFECGDCGYIELPGPTKEELDERALNPFLDQAGRRSRNQANLNVASKPGVWSAPASAEPVPPIFRSEPEWRDENELNERYERSQARNAEKHTYMAVYFFATAVMLIVYVLLNANGRNLVSMLTGAVVLAFLITLLIAFPLYYEMSFARQACMVFLSLGILVLAATVVMSIFASMFGSAWYLIPHIFLNGWLIRILWRDLKG